MAFYPKALFLIAFVGTLLTASCNSHVIKIPDSNRGIFFWQTIYQPDERQTRFIRDNSISKVYLRIFDIKSSSVEGGYEQVAPIIFKCAVWSNIEMIPCVFFTHNVFDVERSREFCQNIVSSIESRISNHVAKWPKSILIDYDWTPRTAKTYFQFLNYLNDHCKGKYGTIATIRLHQVKYRKLCGIPPSPEGLLMVYNVKSPTTDEPTESIFSKALVLNYLKDLKNYPLPLGIALPAFSQTIHLQKNCVLDVMFDFSPDDYRGYLKRSSATSYSVTKKFIHNDNMFLPGDIIRIDKPRIHEIRQVARTIGSSLSLSNRIVSYFELNSAIYNYPKEISYEF